MIFDISIFSPGKLSRWKRKEFANIKSTNIMKVLVRG